MWNLFSLNKISLEFAHCCHIEFELPSICPYV
jgi:hypothetical protein